MKKPNNRFKQLTIREFYLFALFWLKYRNKNVQFGENLRIMGNIPIVKIPQKGEIIIGNNVVLNSDFVNSNTSLTTRVKFVTGYTGIIKIGNNCDLNGTCIVSYAEIEIGDYCQFASSTLLTDTDFHPVNSEIRLLQMKGEKISFDEVRKEKIRLGQNVWVGWGAIILKGAEIGNNSIVAAGSVVLKGKYPDNALIAGNPAKVVKMYC